MVRRAIIKHQQSLWPHLSEETKNKTKEGLLHALHHEPSDLMRTKLDDTVADLATHIAANGEWPELLDHLLELSRSEEGMHRQSGLLIFGQILNSLSELLEDYTSQLIEILLAGMNDASLSVRVAGLRATAGFIILARAVDRKVELQPLVPAMVGVLEACLGTKQASAISSCLEVFIDWAIDPLFFHQHFGILLPVMYSVASNGEAQGHQLMAIEFLVALAVHQPRIMHNVPGYMDNMAHIFLNGLMLLDDCSVEEWNNTPDEEFIEVSTADQLDEPIDQFALAIRGKLVPFILPQIVQMIANTQDWRARHAGLMAVSLIGEGCQRRLRESLADLVGVVLPHVTDEHPRVRWAALNALGQLANDFRPVFQSEFHETVMPLFCNMLSDSENPKVQANAAAAIISYCEQAPLDTTVPYMDAILKALHGLLNSSNELVIEKCVTCTGALAIIAKEHFIPYYEHFIPLFKDILAHTEEEQYHDLRSKTIDTFSLIGAAVGKEKFLNDARDFMEAWGATRLGAYGANELRETSIFAAGRICNVLGTDFMPFLPVVLPSLLETASINEDIYMDRGEDTGNGDTEREGWQYSIIGPNKFGIHSYALDEKNAAVRMLYAMVENLEDAAIEYIPSISDIIAPLTVFPYHRGIRAAAASTLPVLLNAVRAHCTKINDMTMFYSYFEAYINNLLTAAGDEEFDEALTVMIDSITELIEMIPSNSIPVDFVRNILNLHQSILTDMRQDIVARKKRVDANDYTQEDEQDWEELDTQIVAICTELSDLYGVTVRHHPQVVIPIWEEYAPFASTLLPNEEDSCNSWMMRQCGLCFFDDSVEHLKGPVLPYLVHIIPFMIHYAEDDQPAVRQAASYGLGTCAQHGGAEMSHWIQESLTALLAVIESPDSRNEEEFQAPTENAICAVGKFILYQAEYIPVEQLAGLVPQWLGWLPLWIDRLEGHVCHAILMTLVERNDEFLFGPDYANLPKILEIISWCITTEGLLYITPEVFTRMKASLVHMATAAPELFNNAAASLPEEQQQLISETLQNHA